MIKLEFYTQTHYQSSVRAKKVTFRLTRSQKDYSPGTYHRKLFEDECVRLK